MKNAQNEYISDVQHHKNKHLNKARINDNKISRKMMIISIKFSKK